MQFFVDLSTAMLLEDESNKHLKIKNKVKETALCICVIPSRTLLNCSGCGT